MAGIIQYVTYQDNRKEVGTHLYYGRAVHTTTIGTEQLSVVGVLPSVVQYIVAPCVAQLISTFVLYATSSSAGENVGVAQVATGEVATDNVGECEMMAKELLGVRRTAVFSLAGSNKFG